MIMQSTNNIKLTNTQSEVGFTGLLVTFNENFSNVRNGFHNQNNHHNQNNQFFSSKKVIF